MNKQLNLAVEEALVDSKNRKCTALSRERRSEYREGSGIHDLQVTLQVLFLQSQT